MLEFEKTYLAKSLPLDLEKCESKEIIDIYIPADSEHPKIRIRKSGEKYELTKKTPANDGDASIQKEQTINLNEQEFKELSKLPGKRLRKIRYYYPYGEKIAEFDVFQEALKGLVLIDFEFENEKGKDSFAMPDFCLADVTQEGFIAGGRLCGKSYEDIENELIKFGYQKLFFEYQKWE